MIVVVDDEPDVRSLVCEILEEEGYTFLAFAHPVPVRALEVIDEQPQLFLLDIMLPQMDGIALAGRLTVMDIAPPPRSPCPPPRARSMWLVPPTSLSRRFPSRLVSMRC